MNNGNNPYAPFTKEQVEAAMAMLTAITKSQPPKRKGAPRKHNWDAVDWSKRNMDVAKELGTNQFYVSSMRKKLGKPKSGHQSRIDWESVDWTKQNRDIAEELQAAPSYVGLMRKKLGKPKPPGHYKRKPEIKENNRNEWKSWGWAMTDAEVGRQHGVCRERARQIRKMLGHKPSPRGQNRKYDWENVDWNQPNHVISKKLGAAATQVSSTRRKLHQKPVKEINREMRLAKWKTWDWTQYDSVLARLHKKHPTIVGQIRKQLGLPRSNGGGKYFRNPRHAYQGK